MRLKATRLYFLFMLIFSSAFFSCYNKEHDREDSNLSEVLTTAKFYQLKYPADSIRNWLADSNFDKLVFQFHAPGIGNADDNMELIAWGVHEYYQNDSCKYGYLNNPADTLGKVIDSARAVLTGEAYFGNLEFSRKKLWNLTHRADSSEFDYDHLFFYPVKNSATGFYVVYRVYMTKNGLIVVRPPLGDEDDSLNPRPPAP